MRRTSPAGLLSKIYRRIGSNIDFDLLNVLASVPDCLETFWAAIEPMWESCLIRRAAEDLRKKASRLAAKSILIPDQLNALASDCYTREDIRQIRYIVEAFYNLEPVFAVIAAIARVFCTSAQDPPTHTILECRLSPGPVFAETILIPDNADQIPPVFPCRHGIDQPSHSIVRALGNWPDYCRKLHEELNNPACAVPFARVTDEVRTCLDAIGDYIVAFLDPYRPKPSFGDNAIPAVFRSMEASCEAIVLASVLRRSFIRSEILNRRRRIIALTN